MEEIDPSESLEYKGMSKIPGKELLFSIHNKETSYKKWLKIGQRTGAYTLTDYLEKNDFLVFEKDGQSGVLELSKAKGAGLPGTLEEGLEIDARKLRFQNGRYYEDGKDTPFTGRVTKSYPNGKPWYKRGYKEGKKHGPTIEWFPNGQKKYEMSYEDNRRTGIWTYWDQKGKMTAKREYENNQFKQNLPLE